MRVIKRQNQVYGNVRRPQMTKGDNILAIRRLLSYLQGWYGTIWSILSIAGKDEPVSTYVERPYPCTKSGEMAVEETGFATQEEIKIKTIIPYCIFFTQSQQSMQNSSTVKNTHVSLIVTVFVVLSIFFTM